jgi:8-oxo-dGTP pyrophosphatase MutT (NUDIX family)
MSIFNFAQKAFIVKEGKLLMVKKSKDDPKNPNKWEVPGGRMKFGEMIEEHIKREVKEEVGLDIKVGDPFAIWTWKIKKKNDEKEEIQIIAVASICYADTINVNAHGQVEDDFLSDMRWVPIDEVMKYDLIPDIIPVVEKFFKKIFENCQKNNFFKR